MVFWGARCAAWPVVKAPFQKNGGLRYFSKSWTKLLVAGGPTFKRARIVTGKISAIITECRYAVAKVRHERAAMEGAEAAKRRQEQLEKEVRVSTMSVMGDRWTAGGSSRLTNSWRPVVLHINDAMCGAGASG